MSVIHKRIIQLDGVSSVFFLIKGSGYDIYNQDSNYANNPVLKYFSPLSGIITTILPDIKESAFLHAA